MLNGKKFYRRDFTPLQERTQQKGHLQASYGIVSRKERITAPFAGTNCSDRQQNLRAIVVGQAFLKPPAREALFTKPTIRWALSGLRYGAEDATLI